MNRRQLTLVALVATVAVLNVWHWWPSTTADVKTEKRADAERLTAEALRVRISVAPEKQGSAQRDLFQPRRVTAKPTVVAPKVVAPPAPPPKTPEQIAEEAARAELNQIKLVGVVFRGEKGEAFVVKGDQSYTVRQGEKLGERFTVESISTDGMSLKDPTTQVSGKISVSGK